MRGEINCIEVFPYLKTIANIIIMSIIITVVITVVADIHCLHSFIASNKITSYFTTTDIL